MVFVRRAHQTQVTTIPGKLDLEECAIEAAQAADSVAHAREHAAKDVAGDAPKEGASLRRARCDVTSALREVARSAAAEANRYQSGGKAWHEAHDQSELHKLLFKTAVFKRLLQAGFQAEASEEEECWKCTPEANLMAQVAVETMLRHTVESWTLLAKHRRSLTVQPGDCQMWKLLTVERFNVEARNRYHAYFSDGSASRRMGTRPQSCMSATSLRVVNSPSVQSLSFP